MEAHLQRGGGRGPAWAESFRSPPFHLGGRMCVSGFSRQRGAPCSRASRWSWEEAAPGRHRASLLCPRFKLPELPGAHRTRPGLPLPWIRAWLAFGLDHRIYLAIPPESFGVSPLVLWWALDRRTTDDFIGCCARSSAVPSTRRSQLRFCILNREK